MQPDRKVRDSMKMFEWYMKKVLIILSILCCGSVFSLYAQRTYAFVERDSTLLLDVYQPTESNGYTVVHVFSGGFITGSRATQWDAAYCRQLAAAGYTAVAIDYRLGLKGVGNVGIGNLQALENAFYIAVEDCSAAIRWLVENASETGIDPQKIILEGSSAGAIAVLMTDYSRCNQLPYTSALPADWVPAGVVAYSGAIYSKQGKVRWEKAQPAPTLLFHGTADRIVNYKQLQFGKLGLFGANALAKRFKKYNLPYCIYRYTDLGHEISIGGPLTVDELNLFVKQYITDGRRMHTDITTKDDAYQPSEFSHKTVRDLYDKKNRKDL